MKRYVYIGLGGVFGAILRYLLRLMPIYNYHGVFPINTLIINITGSFLLSMILTASTQSKKSDPDFRIGITTGFLGAFTTFSTFSKESAGLLEAGYYFTAFSYMALSVLLGIGAAFLGSWAVAKALTGLQNNAGGEVLPESEREAD